MKHFDVIVIGSGGGAKITSSAAKMGLNVAVIEKGPMGGTCLNRGCIPSKMMIYPADVAHTIQHAHKYHIHNNPQINVDFASLVNHITQTVSNDSNSIVAGYTRNPRITLFPGTGRFVGYKTVEIDLGHEKHVITSDKIFITVGARPQIPQIPGLQGTPFMTSTQALRQTVLPQSMIVLGGGYIACELGYAYAAFGTKVEFLVRSQVLKAEDHETRDEFFRVFSQMFPIHTNTSIKQVTYQNNQFQVTYEKNSQEIQATAQSLLVALGVTPNTDSLNLSATGLDTNQNGYIGVDDYLQTKVKGIYAFGDCIGRYLYRHSANFEGEYLFENVFTAPSPRPIIYPPMPHAVFTHPQIAAVGLTEEQARAQNIDYVTGVNSYAKSAMGMAMRSDSGFVKIIIERASKKILGAHIVGAEAADMIHMLIAFMNKNGTLDDLLSMIYIHPALPELVRNAARKAQAALNVQEPLKAV